MPNFEADDTGGGYAGTTKNFSAGGTVLSGGSANTGNSLTRSSVPASSSSPAGGAAAASGLQGYGSSSGGGGSSGLASGSIQPFNPPQTLGFGVGTGSGVVDVRSSSPAARSLSVAPSMDLTTASGMMAAAPMVTMPPPSPVARVGDGADPANVEKRMLVMNIQQGLVDKGANIKVDGIFGRETKGALGAWKRANGIKGWAGFADENVIRMLTGPAPDATGTTRSIRPPAAPLIQAPGEPLRTPGPQTPATPVPPEKPKPGDVVPI